MEEGEEEEEKEEEEGAYETVSSFVFSFLRGESNVVPASPG